jgi:acyl-coenzyme A thioesterase PaaI-like protein
MSLLEFLHRPGVFRRLMNLWPPFLGASIRVDHISPDWREVRTSLPLHITNRNYLKTQYGGNLFSMTDPFLVLILIRQLGSDYQIWDQSAEITFVRPGRSRVTALMQVEPERVDMIRRACEKGEKHLEEFLVNVLDANGQRVARVRKVVYIRLKESRRAFEQ